MKRTAWFLILIGVVLRIRGFLVMQGGLDLSAKIQVSEPGSEDRLKAKSQLFADALVSGYESFGVSGFFMGIGILLLLTSFFWKSSKSYGGGLKKLQNRARQPMRFKR